MIKWTFRRAVQKLALIVFLFCVAVHADVPYVILVSFDGFRSDYPDSVETPNLDRIAREGIKAESLKPIFPSKTFPNHYAIATGMYAEHHGIVSNRFYDPEWKEMYQLSDRKAVTDGRWYGGEPIWVTAEKQGVRTASYYWVGSEAAIGGTRPTYFYYYDENVPFEDRVRQVVRWLNLPETERPHLITVYFHEPDWSGHKYGPNAPETAAAVARADSVTGWLLTGIDTLAISNQINLIICSDHGMTEISSERLIHLGDLIDLRKVLVIETGPFSFLAVKPEMRGNRLKSLFGTRAKKKIVKRLKNAHSHLRVYLKEEIPKRWHFLDNRRILEILLVADDGWSIDTETRRSQEPIHWVAGSHGYDNANKAMHAIFYARGPAFKKGLSIPAFSNIHIYPLIAEILKVEPNPEIDGSLDSVRVMLKSN